MNPETHRFEQLDTAEAVKEAIGKGWKVFSIGETVTLNDTKFTVQDIGPTKLVLRPHGLTQLSEPAAMVSQRMILKTRSVGMSTMVGDTHLKPHQQRVVVEKQELDEKIAKLAAFVGGSIFVSLDDTERSRLSIQLQHMNGYSEILGQRIGAF